MVEKKTDGIPMKHPDGRPYVAEDEVEAMTLMARGYSREDSGQKAPASGPGRSPSSDSKATGGTGS